MTGDGRTSGRPPDPRRLQSDSEPADRDVLVDDEDRHNDWPRLALLGILVGFLALSTVIAVKTPAFESADEPSHVQNIESLVSGHWYGMNSNCRPVYVGYEYEDHYFVDCSGLEAQQAPMYYLLLAGWQTMIRLPSHSYWQPRSFDLMDPTSRPVIRNATFTSANARSVLEERGLFSYHSVNDWHFVLWLRFPNIVLGALTVLVAFFAIRELTDDPWTPVVGAAVVATLPRFVFLSSFVTNDNLVNLLGALFTLLAVRYVRAQNPWRIALVGAVFGLLVATKVSALFLGLAAAVVVLSTAEGWRRRAEHAAIATMAALATCGWYLIQNYVRYGDPLAGAATTRYLIDTGGLGNFPGIPYVVASPLRLILLGVPRRFFDTFWYQSGWNQFYWSWPVSLLFWCLCFAALVGLLHYRVARRQLVTLWTIVAAALLSVWVLAFQTSTYQPRYALVGLAALAALMALGLERWRLPVRFVLPALGLGGTLLAIQQNVLAVHWGT